jgi:colicin import membrane protein
MDRVVPLLAGREAIDPELVRAFVISIGAHLVVLVLLVAWPTSLDREDALVPVPAYIVGLVSPSPDSRILGVGPLAAKPKPAPVKVAPVPKPTVVKIPPPPKPKPVVKPKPKPAPVKVVPEPKPAVVKTPPPKPVAKPVVKPKPAPVKAVPVPTPAPPAPLKAAPVAGEARGLEFVLYYENMLDSIKANWVWAGRPGRLSVIVRFGIGADGTITGMSLVKSSGNESFDRSVLNAVVRSNDLGAPPPRYRKDFSRVELVFRAAEMGQ